MTNPDLVTPIIHLNGTGAEALIENLIIVASAIRAAQRALDEAAPNGRDYYLEPGRLERAMAQHRWRRERLAEVLASVTAEFEAIDEGRQP